MIGKSNVTVYVNLKCIILYVCTSNAYNIFNKINLNSFVNMFQISTDTCQVQP